jgi:SIR2-like domain
MSLLRKRDAIIFLLGAGASFDADIPVSAVMINRLEELVANDADRDFHKHHDLYYYIKSAINYGNKIKKIKKQSQIEAVYNIESLVMSLDELAKKDEHQLYPFIGAWNPKLTELTDKDFQNIKELRESIVDKVRDWVDLKRRELADYYEGLINFHEDYEHPLRIFSLNYDLCVEFACERLNDEYPERGFYARRYADDSLARTWNWQLLDENVVERESKTILLYKLHGSVDWKRHEDGKITFEDSIPSINSKNTAIIFGTSYKLQYYDPFLVVSQT